MNEYKIFQKYNDVLKKLGDHSVVDIGYREDVGGFYMCDGSVGYYWHTLTKDECIELSELFREIAEKME